TTGAPAARLVHAGVWTGTGMTGWGGSDICSFFITGGRYNPGTNSWTATSTTSAPAAREFHTAVWTGSQMIVWGGDNGSSLLSTGERKSVGPAKCTDNSRTRTRARGHSATQIANAD